MNDIPWELVVPAVLLVTGLLISGYLNMRFWKGQADYWMDSCNRHKEREKELEDAVRDLKWKIYREEK